MELFSKEAISDMIYCRELDEDDVEEMKMQHKEWFPLNYPDSYYHKTLKKGNIVKIGCFV